MKRTAVHQACLRWVLVGMLSSAGTTHAQQSTPSHQRAQPSTIASIAAQFDQYGESVITQDSVTINSEVRALALMTERLQAIYGIPITYEDTKYVGAEVADFTRSDNKVIKTITRHISLHVKFEAPLPDASLEARKKLAGQALANAVQSYNSARGDEIFTVTDTEKGFHVVARRFSDTSGDMKELQPLLDTPITIPEGSRTIAQAVTEICKAVPGLSLGWYPINLFTQQTTTISASNEPARSVLDRLLNGVRVHALKPNGNGGYTDTVEGGYVSWELWTSADAKRGRGGLSFAMVKPLGTL